jgi:hypothetical protein
MIHKKSIVKTPKTLALFIALVFFGSFLNSPIQGSIRREEPSSLDDILKNCAEYCERLSNAALHFICIERIDEKFSGEKGEISPGFSGDGTIPPRAETGDRVLKPSTYRVTTRTFTRRPRPGKIEKNTFVYDYQLIRVGKKIEEKRILLEENGKKKDEENAELKTRRFFSKRSVFGPVGLLSKERQQQYNYKIIKEEKVGKRKTVVLEVTPKEISNENKNFGKVWIDKEDFSVLKIEVAQGSLVGIEGSKDKKISHVIKDVHEYNIVKNGIRFPSRTTFEESYNINKVRRSEPNYPLPPTKMGLRWAKTVIEYKDYKFFTVDVDVKY